jgi:hypothetical protein
MMTGSIALNAQLGVHASLPVQHEHVGTAVFGVVDDDLMKHRSQDAFLQLGRRRGMVPSLFQMLA